MSAMSLLKEWVAYLHRVSLNITDFIGGAESQPCKYRVCHYCHVTKVAATTKYADVNLAGLVLSEVLVQSSADQM